MYFFFYFKPTSNSQNSRVCRTTLPLQESRRRPRRCPCRLHSPCRRWDVRRAAVVSEQVRRSSSRSLFSCKANKYLEGNSDVRQISSTGSGTHSRRLRRRTARSRGRRPLLTMSQQLCAEAELQGPGPAHSPAHHSLLLHPRLGVMRQKYPVKIQHHTWLRTCEQMNEVPWPEPGDRTPGTTGENVTGKAVHQQ